ncbi:MAG: TonB C-terminal domain-containing protein [Sulfurimonas sp.]|nr:TonB C-terminal domain-containing protein [Sulfurimonas sp.]
MARNNPLFYISGFISLSLFTFFLAIFIYMMISSSNINEYALEKDNYISISMDIQPKSSKSAKKSLQPTPVESSVSEMPQDVDVNDLFSDVWTKKIQKKKIQPKDSKRIKDIQKKIKTTQANSVESISEKFNELDNSKLNEENSPSSTANEVNEYLAKIQALVYRYFNVPPNSEGYSVMAYIELNSIGKVMDFRILNYSANDALNAEVDKIKDRLKSVVFPINPQNKSFSTKVILKSKE